MKILFHIIYTIVLNAKEHGVPQNRERVFLIGIRDDADNNFRFPIEENLTKRLKDVLESEVADKYYLKPETIEKLIEYDKKQKENGNGFSAKFHDENGTMSALKVGGGGADDLVKIKTNDDFCITANYSKQSSDLQYLKIGTWRTHQDGQGFREIEDGNCPTIPARAREDGSGQPVIKHNYKIRRLTPRECFRLMDFPDTFDFSVVSDSQAYKQAGNSIVVRVLQKIIANLNL